MASSTVRVFSGMFSTTTRATDENLHHLRSELQHLPKQVKVINKSDDVCRKHLIKLSIDHQSASKVRRTRTTAKGSNPGNGEHSSPLKIEHPLFGAIHPQRDCDHYQSVYENAPEGSEKKAKAWQRYQTCLQQRSYIDSCMVLIGEFIFGTTEKASTVMNAVRPAGQPLVDDWRCYDTMVHTLSRICGPLTPYGMKHTDSLANMCNAGVKPETLAEAAEYACSILGKMPQIP